MGSEVPGPKLRPDGQFDRGEISQVQGSDGSGFHPFRRGHDDGIHEPEAEIPVTLVQLNGSRKVGSLSPLHREEATGEIETLLEQLRLRQLSRE